MGAVQEPRVRIAEPADAGALAASSASSAAIERARARGCARIELDANERNGVAVDLYESLGFSAQSSARL